MLQVMTKNIYTPEFQNLTLLSPLTKRYMRNKKLSLQSKNQHPKKYQNHYQNQLLLSMYKPIQILYHLLHKLYLSMILPSSKHKTYFQGFFLSNDYSLDLKTLQTQQSQDPFLRTVHSWISRNEKPEFLTPLITGNLFLHGYYKRFSQLFIDDTTNLISLYTTNPLSPETHSISIPKLLHNTIRIGLPFRMFQTVFNKLHEHSHTGIKITYNTFSQ